MCGQDPRPVIGLSSSSASPQLILPLQFSTHTKNSDALLLTTTVDEDGGVRFREFELLLEKIYSTRSRLVPIWSPFVFMNCSGYSSNPWFLDSGNKCLRVKGACIPLSHCIGLGQKILMAS
jgi:hypothetical protein